MLFLRYRSAFVWLCVGVLLAVILGGSFVYSQETNENEQQELSAEELQKQTNEEKAQQRKELEEQIKAIDAQIEERQQEHNRYKTQGDSYQQQISSLSGQILQIRRDIINNQLILDQTNQTIERNESVIEGLEKRKLNLQESLKQLFVAHYKQEQVDEITIILSHDNIADFFDEIQRRSIIQDQLQDTVDTIQDLQKQITEEQNKLATQVDKQLLTLGVQQINQENLAVKQGEQKQLLAQTQQSQAHIQGQIDALEKTKAQIRSQLYVLQGVGVATSFGQAYDYAKVASNITGVRPAFLLALFQRESRWGQHIGSCYFRNAETGSGVNFKNNNSPQDRVLKASRDVQPFLQIMAELGRDPYNTPISCPHPNYGYGGGMGPAQFIPSTWMGYKNRLAGIFRETR